MLVRRPVWIVASLVLVTTACADDSAPATVSAVRAGVAQMPATGPATVGAGPGGALAIVLAKSNEPGDGDENTIVLMRPDGTVVEPPPLPSSDPLGTVAMAALDDGFVVVGSTCPAATSSPDEGCGEGELEAFHLDGTGRWHRLPPPPQPAEAGAQPLDGSAEGRFFTGGGSLVTYDPDDDTWHVVGTGATAIEGACPAGRSWVAVGRTVEPSNAADPTTYETDWTILDPSGIRATLADSASSSGPVACDPATGRLAFITSDATHVYDPQTGVTTLPPLPDQSERGHGARFDGDQLVVPVYRLDDRGTGPDSSIATDEIATITIAPDATWAITDNNEELPSWSLMDTASWNGVRYATYGVNDQDQPGTYDHLELRQLD